MKHTSLLLIAGIALMACTPGEPTAPSSTGAADPAAATAPAATPDPAAAPMPPADQAAAVPQTPGADTCNMAQYSALIGKPVTDSGVPAASPTVRIIKPDTQVTMDFAPARLNIDVNSAGVITGMKCG
jgi:hypothetical protein